MIVTDRSHPPSQAVQKSHRDQIESDSLRRQMTLWNKNMVRMYQESAAAKPR